VKTIATALLLLSTVSCNSVLGKKIVADVKACADPAIQAEVTNLLPAVTTILVSGKPDWQTQLSALEGVGAQFVVCAVMTAVADLSSRASTMSRTGKVASATSATAAAARGKQYLYERVR